MGATRTTSREEYLGKLVLPQGYSVDLEHYISQSEGKVILTCPQHGMSEHNPRTLLRSKHKCASCADIIKGSSRLLTFEEFVKKADVLFETKYDYSQVEYVNTTTKITIICNEHGPFIQMPSKHLQGRGCRPCLTLANVLAGKTPGDYSEENLERNPELAATPATLYYLRVGDKYKIGITTQKIEKRVSPIRTKSQADVEILKTHQCPLLDAFRAEQKILSQFKHARVYRKWSTELFSYDVLGEVSLEDEIETRVSV